MMSRVDFNVCRAATRLRMRPSARQVQTLLNVAGLCACAPLVWCGAALQTASLVAGVADRRGGTCSGGGLAFGGSSGVGSSAVLARGPPGSFLLRRLLSRAACRSIALGPRRRLSPDAGERPGRRVHAPYGRASVRAAEMASDCRLPA